MKVMYLDNRSRARVIKNVGMIEGFEDNAMMFKIFKTKVEGNGTSHTLFKIVPKSRVILIVQGDKKK